MARGWIRGNNYERWMTSVIVLEAANENYELLPIYLLPFHHRAKMKAETMRRRRRVQEIDRLSAQIRTFVCERPWRSSQVKRVLSAAIYIDVAMPRGPVRRETVSFSEKQITGVDQRRRDLLFGFGLT